MAGNSLQLKVILSALDKATAPLKRIQGGSLGAAKALKEARDKLKELNTQQKDISAWRTQRAAAEQTEQALGAARDKVKQLSREFAAAGVPTRQMTRDLKSAIREATALKRQHSEQQTQLQGLRNKLNAAGISTRNLGAGERDLRAKIAATNAAISEQGRRMQRLATQQKRLALAKAQYEKTQGMAGSMAGSGAAGLASGSGILYAGAQLMAPGAQFDADMSQVQALTRLSKDDEQLAAMRAQARQLGSDTMFSATDAAQGQGYLAMAGFNPQAILDAMPGMLDLAKAGNEELAATSDIASNILTGMNLQAKDMGRVGDILVGTFTRSNTNLQMLGETMKYVGPVASSVGQDIETVAAMAGKLGDAGIQGSMGGTALRAILNRLSAPPAAAAKALDKLGISAKDAQGNMRQMPDILTELYEKTKSLGNADRAGLLKGIAGEEAVSALQVLVKQAGSGDLQKFIGTLREAQGEAGKTAKVMGDNLVGDLDELSSAWEDLGIQLEEQQDGPLREIVQSLADVVGGVKRWIVENPTLAAQIVKTAAGLGILMATMGAITLALASILGPFAMVRFAMMLLGIKSLGLVTGLKALGGALLWVSKAVLLVGRALMLNPIGLAVTAIAAAVYLIYANWDKLGPYFAGMWAEVKAGFSGGLGGIITTLANFNPIGLVYRAFAEVLNYLGLDLPVRFTEFGNMIVRGLVNGLMSGMGQIKSAITTLGDSTIGWFKEKLGIHSPSRVFATLGGFTMAGLANGLAGGEGDVLKQIAGTAKRLASSGADMISGKSIEFDKRPPISAASGGMVIQGDTNHFQIHATPGTDVAGLHRMINQMLDERERNKATRIRARLGDLE
ncbi:phage tail tape measure protein [Pseudomonas peli]|uniref:phage tail tape measure protein n=1 Tax=Pseudomonas peli TaxID=592361 RepID=UPI00285E38A6|nr:phage tail tape measure protein [Pseudomonas peli]MDR7024239.1 TP901 family phage tail tape measure protein [Pseudomonas peli]